MDDCYFDRVARLLAVEHGDRRGVLRLLAGGALGTLAARLGLTEDAEAKRKHKKPKKRPFQAKRDSRGPLQAEGKGKKKGKGKGKGKKPKDPPPLPPGCQNCNDCQMCQDGACVPDPALNGVRCEGSGATCGYCQAGQCVGSVVSACADGVCPQKDQCCPDERRCLDPESPTGFACLAKDACCVDERRCDDGCLPRISCCPEDRPDCGRCGEFCDYGTWTCSTRKPCAGDVCVPVDECCPEEWQCLDGTCVAQDECCQNERRCPDGSCVSEGACCSHEMLCPGAGCIERTEECCPTQKYCGRGVCVNHDECCPDEIRCDGECRFNPACSSPCGELACEDGELVCRPRNGGEPCNGSGAVCCNGRCTPTTCPPAENGAPRHFNPETCSCDCDYVESCPPGMGWSHRTCTCVCNCAGRCCLSGCCTHPDGGGAHCCQGF